MVEPVAATVTINVSGYTYRATVSDLQMDESRPTRVLDPSPGSTAIRREIAGPPALRLSATVIDGEWTREPSVADPTDPETHEEHE